jgi:hypothetical protein
MSTYNVTLSANYTVNAVSEEEAIHKAKSMAQTEDLDAGYSDVEEIGDEA